MQLLYEWRLPIITVSEANSTEHWSKKHKRHKAQKNLILLAFKIHSLKIELPCVIKLIRLSPRLLDDDNLLSAFKFIRDEISSQLIPGLAPGRADSDPRIKWEYNQEKSKTKGIKIQFFSSSSRI